MIHQMLSGIGLLAIGGAASALLLWTYLQPQDPPIATDSPPALALPAVQSAGQSGVNDDHAEALEQELNHYREWTFQLETQVIELENRLSVLEEAVSARSNEQHRLLPIGGNETTPSSTAATAQNPALSEATLIAGGLDPRLAAEIVNRQNRLDMRQLELRDRAMRDGSFGKEAYFNALRQLNGQFSDLRSEIGDAAYDRYLYAMGRSNRVVVSSVIPGSAADQAGFQEGDLLLDYDGKRLFNGSELRNITTQGERGELVPVTLRRSEMLFNLSVPRGPLGVRMGSKRIDPTTG
jgi:hypothetical protein